MNDYEKKQVNNRPFKKPPDQNGEPNKKNCSINEETDLRDIELEKEGNNAKQKECDLNIFRAGIYYKNYSDDDSNVTKTHSDEFKNRCTEKGYEDSNETDDDMKMTSECDKVETILDKNFIKFTNQNKINCNSKSFFISKNMECCDMSYIAQNLVEDHAEIGSRRRSVSFALDASPNKMTDSIS